MEERSKAQRGARMSRVCGLDHVDGQGSKGIDAAPVEVVKFARRSHLAEELNSTFALGDVWTLPAPMLIPKLESFIPCPSAVQLGFIDD